MNHVLVVFCENLLETDLSFVVSGSKLIFFVGQILNSRISFILERREYITFTAYLDIVYIFVHRFAKLMYNFLN